MWLSFIRAGGGVEGPGGLGSGEGEGKSQERALLKRGEAESAGAQRPRPVWPTAHRRHDPAVEETRSEEGQIRCSSVALSLRRGGSCSLEMQPSRLELGQSHPREQEKTAREAQRTRAGRWSCGSVGAKKLAIG